MSGGALVAVRRGGRCGTALLALLMLGACAVAPPPRGSDAAALRAQETREATLAARDQWSLEGRLAVSGGGNGGSGQLSWRQHGSELSFEMRAPVSRQTWRLTAAPGTVRLDGLEGGPRHGADAEAMLQTELGWSLPLADLGAWVRGMRGRGPARVEFDAHGLPRLIEQHGWRIEYRSWDRASDPALPTRVFASRGDRRVRLAVSRWDIRP